MRFHTILEHRKPRKMSTWKGRKSQLTPLTVNWVTRSPTSPNRILIFSRYIITAGPSKREVGDYGICTVNITGRNHRLGLWLYFRPASGKLGLSSSYRAGKCLIRARKIKDSASMGIFLKELAAVSREEIPLGAETALCSNATNGLEEVRWGDIAIRIISAAFNI